MATAKNTPAPESDDWLKPSGPASGPSNAALSTFTLNDIHAGQAPTLRGGTPIEEWMWHWMFLARLLWRLGEHRLAEDDDPAIARMGTALRGFLMPFRLDCVPERRGALLRQIVTEAISAAGEEAERHMAAAIESFGNPDEADIAVWSWWKFVTDHGYHPKPANLIANAFNDRFIPRITAHKVRRVMWQHGPRTADYSPSFGDGLRSLYERVGKALEEHFVPALPPPDDFAAVLTEILPEPLANLMIERGWRPEPIQRALLADPSALEAVCDGRASKVVTGPAGCGKSLLARLVTAARERRHGPNVIVAVPTRALVNQVADDYQEWNEDAKLNWRIARGSRDYHRDDLALQRGDFDVAVCVYEKLGAMLSMPGSDLMLHCGLIVVDEAHNIAHGDRGAKLEELLTLVRLHHPHVPLLLVSAGIEQQTAGRLTDWLELDPHRDVLTATITAPNGTPVAQRPVPLDIHVLAPGAHRKMRDPASPPEPGVEVGIAEEVAPVDLTGAELALSSGLRDQLEELPTGHALAVAGDILRREPLSRILLFVRARRLADSTAVELRKLIEELGATVTKELDEELLGDLKNPWIGGRFAGGRSTEEARDEYRRFTRTVEWDGRREVLAALRSGVGVHRGGMTHVLRGYIEREFAQREGLLRVVVATDSLAEGVNLPADVVLMGNLTVATSRRGFTRIIDLANFKNKVGRAGRKGHAEHGAAYVLAPERLQELQLDRESEPRRSWIAGTDGIDVIDAIWDNYVAPVDPGAPIASTLTTLDRVATLVLRHLARIQRGARRLEPSELVHETTRALDASLASHCEEELPTAERVLESLVERKVLDGGRVTKLGIAIARGSLSVSDAPILRELIASILGGQPPLTQLYWAARLPSVRDSLNRINLPEELQGDTYDEVQEGLRAWASSWMVGPAGVAIAEARLRGRAGETRRRFDTVVQKKIKGELPAAPPLADVYRIVPLSTDPLNQWASQPALDGDALFRALVAIEWAAGQRYAPLSARARRLVIDGLAAQASRTRPPAPFELGDLEQLTGLVSWALRAAIMALPVGEHRRRAVELATSTAVGLPRWMAPLARLEIAGLHRELLIKAADHDAPDDIADALDWPELDIHPDDVRDARNRLRALDLEREYFAGRVLEQRMAIAPRDGAPDYGSRAHELAHAPDAKQAARTVIELLDDHDVDATLEQFVELPEGGCALVRAREPDHLEIAVFAGARRLTGAVAEQLAAPGRRVLSIPGLDDDAKAIAEDGTFLRVGSFLNLLSDAYLNAADSDDVPDAIIQAFKSEPEPESNA